MGGIVEGLVLLNPGAPLLDARLDNMTMATMATFGVVLPPSLVVNGLELMGE